MVSGPVIYPEVAYQTQVVPEALSDGATVYVAWHPEIRGVRAHGATPEEALQSLSEAFDIYVERVRARGFEMPMPQSHAMVREVIWRTAVFAPSQGAAPSTQLVPSGTLILPVPGAETFNARSSRESQTTQHADEKRFVR